MNQMAYLLKTLEQTQLDEKFSAFKDHLLIMHQTVYDIMKRQARAEQDIAALDRAFQQKIDLLSEEKEKANAQKMEILEQSRKRVRDLEGRLQAQEAEAQKSGRELQLKVQFLQQELSKNVNTQYIKNILLKFVESEYQVQLPLTQVIGTVLQFSDAELERFRTHWQRSVKLQTSLNSFGKLITNKFNALKPH